MSEAELFLFLGEGAFLAYLSNVWRRWRCKK